MFESQKLVDWYETLNQETLKDITNFYAEDLFFKDPIHEFKNRSELLKYFQNMFTKLKSSKFIFHSSVHQDQNIFLTWDFEFEVAGRPLKIHGASHLRLDSHGKVNFHRDYWDLAEEVYEKIPLLGALFKGLKKLFS